MKEDKKYEVGFIQGVFDLFHIGHLNLLKKAKDQCEHLIVGVNSDDLVQEYKNKIPVVPVEERMEIVAAIKHVDSVVIMKDRDKIKAAKEHGFDVIFMGDDWKGTPFYEKMEKDLALIGVKIEYFPYTSNISSTKIRNKIQEEMEKLIIEERNKDRVKNTNVKS